MWRRFPDSSAAAGVAPLSCSMEKVLKSGFHLSSAYKWLLLCSLSSVCLFFSSHSLFSLSSADVLCFSTAFTRGGWLKCERLPWLIPPLQTNGFFPSSYLFGSPVHFIYRSEVDFHLRSLCEIDGVFCCWLIWMLCVPIPQTLAAAFSSCPGSDMAGSVVEAFIIQPSQ